MNESLPKRRLVRCLVRASVLGLIAVPVYAQSGLGLFGNTHIGSGSQLYSAYPAILLGTTTTARATPYGALALNSAAFYNAGSTALIDGYVSVTTTGTIVFPVGSGTVYAPVTVVTTTPGTIDAAYNTGSFNADSFDPAVLEAVSTDAYWDILGTNSVAINLTWQPANNIAGLSNDLARLTVAGWNGTQWAALPSVLSEGATTDSGTLTVNGVDLNGYSAFTFARTYETVSGIAAPKAPAAFIYLKNGMLNLDAQKTVAAITLYDLTGKLVASYTVNNTAFNAGFAHATGIYLASVQFTDGTSLTRKLANY